MSRQTRQGTCFSPFAAVEEPIVCDLNIEELLRLRYAEMDASPDGDQSDRETVLERAGMGSNLSDLTDFEDDVAEDGGDISEAFVSALASPTPSSIPSHSFSTGHTSTSVAVDTPSLAGSRLNGPPLHTNHYKTSSKKRRSAKRRRDQETSGTQIKGVVEKRRLEALQNVVEVDIDAASLPVNSSGFGGLRRHPPKDHRSAEQLEAAGFRRIRWQGKTTIPLVDRQRRMWALLGGMPRDAEAWKREVGDDLAEFIEKGRKGVRFSTKERHHKRGPFPAVAIGMSYGGGEMKAGNRLLSKSAARFMRSLLARPSMQRLAGFVSGMFKTYNPALHAEYEDNLNALTSSDSSLRRNFDNSPFACTTVNFGPRSTTDAHVDSANRPDGWCDITALGPFDHTKGGQIVFWDAKLVVDFPAASTIYIPSACVVHSNCGIRKGERRYSITQYSAGGLFRWVYQKFQTQEAFLEGLTQDEYSQYLVDRENRWKYGLRFFPVLK